MAAEIQLHPLTCGRPHAVAAEASPCVAENAILLEGFDDCCVCLPQFVKQLDEVCRARVSTGREDMMAAYTA